MATESKDWIISDHTPLCLVLAPNALYEKIKYLRWTDGLLDHVSDHEPLTPIYRHNLYESWIVFFWSYLEALVEETCDEIENQAQDTVRLRRTDIKANSKIERISKYLELVRNEKFMSKDLKELFDAYIAARNICAHGAGERVDVPRVDTGGLQYTFIKFGGGFQRLSKKEAESLSALPGITIDGDTYRLTSEFCEGLLRFGIEFVRELQRVTHSLGERSAKFLNQRKIT